MNYRGFGESLVFDYLCQSHHGHLVAILKHISSGVNTFLSLRFLGGLQPIPTAGLLRYIFYHHLVKM